MGKMNRTISGERPMEVKKMTVKTIQEVSRRIHKKTQKLGNDLEAEKAASRNDARKLPQFFNAATMRACCG
jgi:hypothetical protein